MGFEGNLRQKYEDLRSGKVSCEENVKHFLAEIEKNNEKYNIVLQINDSALDEAKKLDNLYKNKGNLGRLFGFCFLIKSNISKKDMFISCGSNTLENYKGSFDSDVVRKIESEGGIILGIANNDEFASGSSGESSFFGNTQNPVAIGRIPGGSSSGSAAAVAAGFCDIALGSDTGGSIRNPASHCGIVGIKPSYGRVSRYGLVDLSMSLDQIGPLSKDIFGSALALSVISGQSDNDPTTTDDEVFDYTDVLSGKPGKTSKPNKNFKIGVVKEFEQFISDSRIKELFSSKLDKLKAQGHEIVELNIKNIDLAIQAYYPIVYTEFYSGTRKFDGIKYGEKIEDSGGEEVLRRIFGGREISKSEFDGAYYKKALKVKEVIAKEFDRVFKEVDFILTPVTPRLPHKFEENITPQEMYAYDAFTIPANLGGICAGVISNDRIEDGGDMVPVGIQVFAAKFNEKNLFKGLDILENLEKNS